MSTGLAQLTNHIASLQSERAMKGIERAARGQLAADPAKAKRRRKTLKEGEEDREEIYEPQDVEQGPQRGNGPASFALRARRQQY
jgi:hypothetical protein